MEAIYRSNYTQIHYLHIHTSKTFVSGIAPLCEAHANGNAIGAGQKLIITTPATKEPTRYVGVSDFLVKNNKLFLVGITIKMIVKHLEFCIVCGFWMFNDCIKVENYIYSSMFFFRIWCWKSDFISILVMKI